MAKISPRTAPVLLRVVELFAGVGGFRVGLERAGGVRVVWSNQWEPGKRKQHASDIYRARFGDEHHVCADIATIGTEDIPDHDMLVGGFPCQDYSVASTLKTSKGLMGKKGVLWWQIHRILQEKKKKPRYILLENVDRLLGSPAGQRGRDFAVMLASLSSLGYVVEWRVINAADYGMPQRRRRVFILGRRSQGPSLTRKNAFGALVKDGLFASVFPASGNVADLQEVHLDTDLVQLTKNFNVGRGKSPFLNAGVMQHGRAFTLRVTPRYSGTMTTLGSLLQDEGEVAKEFFIPKSALRKWSYLKGAKKESRTVSGTGHQYHYAEGAMAFPDALDKPARTIITGEGGASPSRFKHVVRTALGKYRRLTPVELERINMFPDGHTAGVSDAWRAFFMGNALVTGVVERIGAELYRLHERSSRATKE